MLFDKSLTITRRAEGLILGEDYHLFPMFDFVHRQFIYPVKLVLKGVDIGMKEIIKFSFLYFTLAFLFIYALGEVPVSTRPVFIQVYVPIIFAAPIFLSLFPAPSTFCDYGIKDRHIDYLLKIIQSQNIGSLSEVENIRRNIEIFEARVIQKIHFLRSILAISWAGFLYLFNNSEYVTSSVQQEYIFVIFSIGFVLILSFAAVEGYSKGNLFIFKGIIFSLNEHEGNL